MRTYPFKSVAAAITLSTTAALAPGFTAQAEAQASNPGVIYASAEHANDIVMQGDAFARQESDDRVVIMIIQPAGGDAEALSEVDRMIAYAERRHGVPIDSFVIEAEGQRGTDVVGFLDGSTIFVYDAYSARDIAGQAGIMVRDINDSWEDYQAEQSRVAQVSTTSPEPDEPQ